MQNKIHKFYKIVILMATFCSLSYSFAFAGAVPVIELLPEFVKITPPFTSSGIAYVKVRNNTDEDLTITGVNSPQSRYSKLYEVEVSELGIPTKKEVKSVNIRALKTTQFAEKTFQIMLIGLEPDITSGQEVQLDITTQNKLTFSTRIPVVFSVVN